MVRPSHRSVERRNACGISIASNDLRKWLELYPESLIMQEDLTFKSKFDSLARFENGKSKSRLTRRDSLSWQMKSWVVGVVMDTLAKAYDWNDLVRLRIIVIRSEINTLVLHWIQITKVLLPSSVLKNPDYIGFSGSY
ncbi:MAG: hypothetical protein U0T81_03825 [Saprospiraceae bacterium]